MIELILAAALSPSPSSSSPKRDPVVRYSECVRVAASKDATKADRELVAERALKACRTFRGDAAKALLEARRNLGHCEWRLADAAVAVDAVATSEISIPEQNEDR